MNAALHRNMFHAFTGRSVRSSTEHEEVGKPAEGHPDRPPLSHPPLAYDGPAEVQHCVRGPVR